MLALVIVLVWLLVNTFATLAFMIADGTGIDSWGELAELALWAVLSPWVCFGIGFIIKQIRKQKKTSEPKIYWAIEEDE